MLHYNNSAWLLAGCLLQRLLRFVSLLFFVVSFFFAIASAFFARLCSFQLFMVCGRFCIKTA